MSYSVKLEGDTGGRYGGWPGSLHIDSSGPTHDPPGVRILLHLGAGVPPEPPDEVPPSDYVAGATAGFFVLPNPISTGGGRNDMSVPAKTPCMVARERRIARRRTTLLTP